MRHIAGNDLGDPRVAQVLDETRQRNLRIKLLKREELEANALWKEKQMRLYPSGIMITNTPTLQEVLIEENMNLGRDEDVNFDRATKNLMQVADRQTVQYILDRLTSDQIFILNQKWTAILEKLKKTYNKTGLDKDIFINFIISFEKQFVESNIETQDISDRARTRIQNENELRERIEKSNIPEMQDPDGTATIINPYFQGDENSNISNALQDSQRRESQHDARDARLKDSPDDVKEKDTEEPFKVIYPRNKNITCF